MPEPLHPPYSAGALTSPRQLNRWLDVNAQNGPLTRTQTYITLPAFSQAVTWRGYSEIVAAFNFEAPNNFSLKGGYSVPVDPNYVLCVMWEDSARVTHRYVLWTADDSLFYFDIPAYAGQLIKANFRLEVWSTNNTPAVQATALNFYTSVLGDTDYRYGVDDALVVADAVVTDFSESNTVPALPNDANNLLLQRFISTQGFIAPDWSSIVDISVISSADALSHAFVSGPDVFTMIKTTGAALTGAVTGTSNYVFAVVYLTGAVGNLVNFDGSPAISATATTITFGADIAPTNGANKLYLLVADYVNNIGTVIEMYTQLTATIALTLSAPIASTALTLLSAATTNGVLEVFSYFNLTDFQGVYDYVFSKYGGFSLPLTFPNNSVPQLN